MGASFIQQGVSGVFKAPESLELGQAAGGSTPQDEVGEFTEVQGRGYSATLVQTLQKSRSDSGTVLAPSLGLNARPGRKEMEPARQCNSRKRSSLLKSHRPAGPHASLRSLVELIEDASLSSYDPVS